MLQMISFGIVAANKALSSKTIEVTPTELLNMSDGELTDNYSTAVVKTVDSTGASSESTINSTSTVTATWLPFGSNRATAPDVRRGEKVCVWKYADADKYYWSELEYEGKLRQLETIIFCISNTQETDQEPTPENTYFVEWSTHNKILHVHTSKSDGEKFSYDLMINAKDGNIIIQDDIENAFMLDSVEKRLFLRNTSGSFLDIDKKNITLSAVDELKLLSGGKTIQTASGGVVGSAPSVVWDTPTFTISGDTSIRGALSVRKSISFGGGARQTGEDGGGDVEFQGAIRSSSGAYFTGTVRAADFIED